MILSIVITLFGLASIIGILRPRFGAVLLWLFPWIYPNTLLYGTLPLNIRFDDLWVVYMFLICFLLYRQGAVLGKVFWLSVFWWVTLLIGNLVGVIITGGEILVPIFKSATKSIYVPFTTYVLSCLVSDEKQTGDHLKGMSLAGAIAGVLGIAMIYLPRPLSAFLIPHYLAGYNAEEIIEFGSELTRRAQGAVGTMGLATITMCLSVVSLMMVVHQVRGKLRVFFALMCVVLLVSLAYTNTRGAIAGFIAATLWGILFTKKRGTLIVLALLGAIMLAWQGEVFQRIMIRITGMPGGPTTPLWESMATRIRIWNTFLEHFNPVYVMFGMGMITSEYLNKATAHNAYIGAFIYGGLLGVVSLVAVIAYALSLAKRLRTIGMDPFSQALSTTLTAMVVAMMVNGLVLENFQQSTGMQIYFAAMIFVDKRLRQVQVEQEAWLDAYAEPVEQLQPAV
jgi:hypothetical protein